MAKIYTVKKNGKTAYPRTISDAVAVTGSTLTDALNNIKEIANLAYGEAAAKQPLLESGKNIKTVNGKSLVGEGNVPVFTGISIGEGYGKYVPSEDGDVNIPAYIQEIKTPFDAPDSLKPSDSTCSVTLPLFVRGMMFNGVPTTPTSMGELVINAVTDVKVNGASVVNDGVANLGSIAKSITLNDTLFTPDKAGDINLGTLVKIVTINDTPIPNPTGTVNLGSVVTDVKIGGDTSAVVNGIAVIGTYIGGIVVNGKTYLPPHCGDTINLGTIGGSCSGIDNVIINGNYAPKPDNNTVNLGTIPIVTEGNTINIGTNSYPNMYLTCDTLKIGTTTQWSVIDLDGSIVAQTNSSYFEAGTNASGGEFAMWTTRNNSEGFNFDMDNSGGIKFGHGIPSNYSPQINITQEKTVITDNINNGNICLTDGRLELSGDIYATSGEITLGGTSGTTMTLKADIQADKLLITCGSKKAEIPLS